MDSIWIGLPFQAFIVKMTSITVVTAVKMAAADVSHFCKLADNAEDRRNQ